MGIHSYDGCQADELELNLIIMRKSIWRREEKRFGLWKQLEMGRKNLITFMLLYSIWDPFSPLSKEKEEEEQEKEFQFRTCSKFFSRGESHLLSRILQKLMIMSACPHSLTWEPSSEELPCFFFLMTPGSNSNDIEDAGAKIQGNGNDNSQNESVHRIFIQSVRERAGLRRGKLDERKFVG